MRNTMFSASESRRHILIIRTGTLELAKPSANIWTATAPSGACMDATCRPSRVSLIIREHPPARVGGDPAISPDRRIDTLAIDPGQSILDPGLRPGAPRHGEELEPLLDEEVRVH